MSIRFAVPPTLALLALMACLGCSSGSLDAHVKNGTGTVQVHLTDAPIDLTTVQSVIVTITDVTVYPRDDSSSSMPDPMPDSPVELMTHPSTFDLLTLTGGATTLLASGEVPAGRYSRIRLGVSDAQLTYKDGTSVALKIESEKVDVPIAFEVGVNEMQQLTLDFDAAASVQVNQTASGTSILRPVVTPVP
jgi:hypothetical protein